MQSRLRLAPQTEDVDVAVDGPFYHHAVAQRHFASPRSQLAYRSRHARQPIAVEPQLLQRGELPDLNRQTRQLIVVEPQLRQRGELPDLRWQARQLIAAEKQLR